MFFGGAVLSCFALLVSFLVLCTVQVHGQNLMYNRGNEVNIPSTTMNHLQCYDCNSEYDPRCADPFNPYTIGIVNCSERTVPEHLVDYLHPDRPVEAVVCRKTVQRVEGNLRVIRGCGYIKDDHDDKKCYRRTGTAAVEVIYCSCTKSLCNKGHSSQRPYYSIIVMTVAITMAITSLLGIQSP